MTRISSRKKNSSFRAGSSQRGISLPSAPNQISVILSEAKDLNRSVLAPTDPSSTVAAAPRSSFEGESAGASSEINYPQQKTKASPRVFLVGAGPGDPDLLTIKAARLIQSADIILHDSLVSPEILALVPPTTKCIDVGKRCGIALLTQDDVNALLVNAASQYKTVVRLKGGDPLLFGRACEEMEALRKAHIDFEIVPGISAAFAAAASAQVSLTDRRLASRVLFTTFSRSDEVRAYSALPIAPDTTVVVYMPGPSYEAVSRWLLDSGLAPETPCLVVSKASQPSQSTSANTIATLATQTRLPAPALLIVGRVAHHSNTSVGLKDWLQQFVPEISDEVFVS